jgi:hypothetical protein
MGRVFLVLLVTCLLAFGTFILVGKLPGNMAFIVTFIAGGITVFIDTYLMQGRLL